MKNKLRDIIKEAVQNQFQRDFIEQGKIVQRAEREAAAKRKEQQQSRDSAIWNSIVNSVGVDKTSEIENRSFNNIKNGVTVKAVDAGMTYDNMNTLPIRSNKTMGHNQTKTKAQERTEKLLGKHKIVPNQGDLKNEYPRMDEFLPIYLGIDFDPISSEFTGTKKHIFEFEKERVDYNFFDELDESLQMFNDVYGTGYVLGGHLEKDGLVQCIIDVDWKMKHDKQNESEKARKARELVIKGGIQVFDGVPFRVTGLEKSLKDRENGTGYWNKEKNSVAQLSNKELMDTLLDKIRIDPPIGGTDFSLIAENEEMEKEEAPLIYTGVFIDDPNEIQKIEAAFRFNLDAIGVVIPENWTFSDNYHMTVKLGKLHLGRLMNADPDLGSEMELEVHSFGVSDKAIAFGVKGYMSKNKIQHITLAFETSPADSNKIKNWIPLSKPFKVTGVIRQY